MTPTLIAIIVAIVGPLATFLAVARKLSGRIVTSEAGDLWQESAAIRTDLLRRNEWLSQKLDNTVTRLQVIEDQLRDLSTEVQNLRGENGRLKAENTKLRKRVTELEALNGH